MITHLRLPSLPTARPAYAQPWAPLFYALALTAFTACGASPATQEGSAPGALSAQTMETQARLGPIQGELTREKVLDRLEGYELCGLSDPVQRGSLRFRFTPVEHGWQLIEVECFFFAIQGLYQFLAVHPTSGVVSPLIFERAPPAPAVPSQGDTKSAVYLNQGRYELCGAPRYDAQAHSLETTCKGNATGTCGVYALYQLSWQSDTALTPSFTPKQLRAQSCSLPSSTRDVAQWPSLR